MCVGREGGRDGGREGDEMREEASHARVWKDEGGREGGREGTRTQRSRYERDRERC